MCNVSACVTSENTECGPLQPRYMTVLEEIRDKIQRVKKTLLESVVKEKKRLLEMVGGYDNDVDRRYDYKKF